MAVRSYNGRELLVNPNMVGTGSTSTNNSFIGSSSQGFGMTQGSSGTGVALYTTFLNVPVIKLTVAGLTRSGAAIGNVNISNFPSITGSTITVANLDLYAPKVVGSRTYKVNLTYYLESLTATTGSAKLGAYLVFYDVNGNRLTTTGLISSTAISTEFVKFTGNYVAPSNAKYMLARICIEASTDPTTGGGGVFYVSNFSLTEVFPTRTPVTTRTTSTNRVAVRDMGTALSFDGVNDYVEIPDANLPASTFQSGFTLAAWINPKTLGGANLGMIMHKATSTTSASGFRYFLEAVGRVGFSVGVGTTRYAAVGRIIFNEDSFVTVTYAADGTVIHYINGVLSAQTSGTSGLPTDITTTLPLRIGNRSNATDRAFDGIIDNPRIWNRALTATEIANLYFNNIVPRNGLVGEWLFNETTGTTALDSSGNGNDGTITGATYTTDTPLRERTLV